MRSHTVWVGQNPGKQFELSGCTSTPCKDASPVFPACTGIPRSCHGSIQHGLVSRHHLDQTRTIMPQYAVKELRTREEMDAVVDVIWKAQYSPYMPSASMFFPVFGYTKEDRVIGIAASKDRLWNEHASDPSSSHWVFVEDTATTQIIAGALWEWHEGGISTNGVAKVDMYWWPKGEAKEFCEEMIRQTLTPRSLWMQRPHAGDLFLDTFMSKLIGSAYARLEHDGCASRIPKPRCWWANDGLGQSKSRRNGYRRPH